MTPHTEMDSIRSRWPAGVMGTIRYFTDHVIFRHTRPIDWAALHAIEEGMLHGHPIFEGGFSLLTDDEAAALRSLGKGGTVEHVCADLGRSHEQAARCLASVQKKLGARDLPELVELAERYAR